MKKLDDTQVYLPEVWATHARFRANKIALVCGNERLSWRELNEGMNRVANSLLQLKGTSKLKVALLMDNSTTMFQIMFGVAKAGICLVPISTMLTAEQVAALMTDSESNVLIVSDRHIPLANQAKLKMENRLDIFGITTGTSTPDWISFEEWLINDAIYEPDVRYNLHDEFNIIYSSGTTGIPKGIIQTHRARQHWSYSNAIELRFNPESIALATTSLYSNGTWFMLLPPLFVGATIVIMETFSPDNWFRIVEEEAITHTFMVPTQYIGLLESELWDTYNLQSLKYYLSAGSSLRQDTREQLLDHIGPGLFELYGFSEGFATLCRPEEVHKKGSVGTPVVGFDLRIIGEDDQELSAGEVGEIVGYGGGLMKQYQNQPELTADAIWTDQRGRTFFRSGDIGKLDKEGYLYILDRKKDMILSGGFNVFPRDIESIVGRHPLVSDVTVIGVPDDKWGEVPLALVIAKRGANPDPDEILAWANAQLAKPQRLKGLKLCREFPRNALGKVIKRQLREIYREI